MQTGVNPTFESNQSLPGREAAAPALLFPLQEEVAQIARVPGAQQLLFPGSPRSVCEELGLNWWAALKLHEDGWLSFAPNVVPRLDEGQEAELRFVGSLVAAGCDRNMLTALLNGLAKPYSYDLRRLYFDWAARCWRLLPEPVAHPEGAFADWLELLVQKGDVGSLGGIGELARDALSRIQARGPSGPNRPAG